MSDTAKAAILIAVIVIVLAFCVWRFAAMGAKDEPLPVDEPLGDAQPVPSQPEAYTPAPPDKAPTGTSAETDGGTE